MSSIIRIGFHGFWPGFSPSSNIFVNSLRNLGFRVEGSAVKEDKISSYTVCYHSLFGQSPLDPGLPSIVYIGEAVDPPSHRYALSFMDDTSRFPINTYFPLWFLYFNWFPGDHYGWHSYSDYRYLIQAKKPCIADEFLDHKLDKCVVLIGNLTPRRREVINAISSVLPCDCYGPSFGRTLPSGYQAKKELLDRYAFHYCEENTLRPGYVTEKILHSRLSLSIPIYNGINSGESLPLNPEAFVDSRDLQEMALILRKYKTSKSDIVRINRAPLFVNTLEPMEIAKIQAKVFFSSIAGYRPPRFQESCHPFDQCTRGLRT